MWSLHCSPEKMGRRIYLVVEKINELKLIADIAKRLGIIPNIGIRIKLSSSGSGKWEESGGDVSKFGLNSSELLDALSFLEKTASCRRSNSFISTLAAGSPKYAA